MILKKKKKASRKYREEKLTQRLSSGYSACKGQDDGGKPEETEQK